MLLYLFYIVCCYDIIYHDNYIQHKCSNPCHVFPYFNHGFLYFSPDILYGYDHYYYHLRYDYDMNINTNSMSEINNNDHGQNNQNNHASGILVLLTIHLMQMFQVDFHYVSMKILQMYILVGLKQNIQNFHY